MARLQKIGALRAPTGVEATLPEEGEAQRAVSREELDIGRVFDLHAAYVARSLACLGVRERDLPDAVQEVFLVVARRLPEFEGRAALRTWLYGICLRQAFRVRRRAARRREEPRPEPPEPTAANAAGPAPTTPQQEVEKRRALEVALAILDRLDEGKRAVFVLYEVEQLPMSEVAALVGCPLQTAYSRLYAARRRIAAEIAQRKEADQ